MKNKLTLNLNLEIFYKFQKIHKTLRVVELLLKLKFLTICFLLFSFNNLLLISFFQILFKEENSTRNESSKIGIQDSKNQQKFKNQTSISQVSIPQETCNKYPLEKYITTLPYRIHLQSNEDQETRNKTHEETKNEEISTELLAET